MSQTEMMERIEWLETTLKGLWWYEQEHGGDNELFMEILDLQDELDILHQMLAQTL